MFERRILLVEDEESLVLVISDRLKSEGYQVECAGDGESALAKAVSASFDLIILDVALPKKNGFDVCRDLRQRGNETPVLMLTARGQVVDRVIGLKLGADDYLTKPFDMMELLARVEALMRRSRATVEKPSESYAFGDVRVDFRKAVVTRDARTVELSGLELRLLRYFIEHRGTLLTRDELLDKVWGYGATLATRTVDVHVAQLRQKIGAEHVVTVHGLGYKFVS